MNDSDKIHDIYLMVTRMDTSLKDVIKDTDANTDDIKELKKDAFFFKGVVTMFVASVTTGLGWLKYLGKL
jgi:hypothetical protein